MIKTLAHNQKWQDALHSLDFPFKSNDVAKKTTVLSACARASRWALLCLLASPKEQSEVVLKNVAINSFGSKWQDSCDVFENFKASGIQPDKVSYQSTLSSLSKGSQWIIALDLHTDKIRVQSVQSVSAYIVLVRSLAQGKKWRSAIELLQEFHLRRISEQKTHRTDVFGSRAGDERIAPLLTSAMSGCERDAWELVVSSLRDGHVQHIRSDVVMFTSAMKVVPWQTSQTIFAGMRGSELVPDRFTIAAVISSRESDDSSDSSIWEKAVRHLESALSVRLILDVAAYNAATTACAICRQWGCVLRLLKFMEAHHVRADRLSYTALATSLAKQAWEQVLSVIEMMSSQGKSSSFLDNLQPLLSKKESWTFAINIFSETDLRQQSWQMAFDDFSTQEVPANVISEACHRLGWQWTLSALECSTTKLGSASSSLISAFTEIRLWESAFACLEHLWQLESGNFSGEIRPIEIFWKGSQETWPQALEILSKSKDIEVLQAKVSSICDMYKALIESGANPAIMLRQVMQLRADANSFNSLLTSFAKAKHLFEAQQLLMDMNQKALEPSTPTCNMLLAVDEFPMSTFAKMESWKLQPNVASYSTLISACEKQQDTEAALGILEKMSWSAVLPNVVAYSAAISACRGSFWQTSLHLFASMLVQFIEQDVIAYNAAITSCEKGKKADIALALFQEMHQMQIRRTEVTYNALISACEKCSTFHQAVGFFQDMQLKRLRSDAITYNTLISSCSRLSRVGTALSLFSNMTKTLIEPTSVTCSTLINCCGSGKRVATALRLFQHFQQMHVEANLISYNAVISACGNAGLWKQALRIFEEMSESYIEPDVFTYNSLIAASCKAFAVQEAWNFQRKITGTNGTADMVTYISFLGLEDALRCEGDCVSHLCETVQSKAMRFFQQHGG